MERGTEILSAQILLALRQPIPEVSSGDPGNEADVFGMCIRYHSPEVIRHGGEISRLAVDPTHELLETEVDEALW